MYLNIFIQGVVAISMIYVYTHPHNKNLNPVYRLNYYNSTYDQTVLMKASPHYDAHHMYVLTLFSH